MCYWCETFYIPHISTANSAFIINVVVVFVDLFSFFFCALGKVPWPSTPLIIVDFLRASDHADKNISLRFITTSSHRNPPVALYQSLKFALR